MTDITSGDGMEGWISRADRTMRNLEQRLMRARVPRTCTSTTRPDPTKMQPGVPVFETDTNRTIYVNGTQTGFVDRAGRPEEIAVVTPSVYTNTAAQTISGGGGTRVLQFDGLTNGQYLAPRAGWYDLRGYVRLPDNYPGPLNVGLTLGDDNQMSWMSLPSTANGGNFNRFSLSTSRVVGPVTKGQNLSLGVFLDTSSAVTLAAQSCRFSIIPL